ncbi:polyprenyl diphosphate synthase [Spiroplasma citri]|uniref:Isoprenyl transferase n=1 Tax=Spiroplasma citri TaxID=2133 RepID=A0AAJ4EIL1_SPICI|nr:polyprenyl diphosphate synthase [Spiroplasma citri]APE74385.1 undecaprenyl pyrophosphate synthase [Spiroplasma citri]QED24328.1 di-trans,poly-cis-decaprenylcistransferase [Spiroplasma citri]QIA66594.1 di-trans,poly-cis-decaprenylcistransferase [Spiroplasma citri]QIA68476.1 di-trans,poly-cis-decaprenylcistransferase [Spiroplasma citri]QIA70351.1 di-trans,poly-cis-decaprenylcistransferase [Spiroplasma citri]
MKIPQHIAIILDGNGRWATKQGLERTVGHEEGAKRIKDVALKANALGVKYLTIYCFSTENWKRNAQEVTYLMAMPERLLNNKQVNNFKNENIVLNHIGRRTKMPPKTLAAINNAILQTKDNNGMVLTFAFDYGAIEELLTAINQMLVKKITSIDEKTLFQHLYTADLPDVDLMIRCGGEQRLSNFLLLQNRYAELYFTKAFWPEFDENALTAAILDYNNRNRRFGGIESDEQSGR